MNPISEHKPSFFGNDRFIAVITALSLSGHFCENSKSKPKIRHHFYHPFEPTVKSERRSTRTIQIASASFHENTITKVPIAVIPSAGRSQQRSQTKPEVSKNEIARDRRIKRTNIFYFPLSFDVFIIPLEEGFVKPFSPKVPKVFR